MRLLQRKRDGSFELTEYFRGNIPKYAILSHTWLTAHEEVGFHDLVRGNAHSMAAGSHKIQFCGERAAKDGLEYFWVDTCCIDKSNIRELQEAIKSMFLWYRNATKCYVYLSDVSVPEDPVINQVPAYPWESAFRGSRWFTRGWTLLELIAPASVEFFSVEGTRLGDKRSLERYIHQITGIPRLALRGHDLAQFSVAERLSWAENRQTTFKEDKAYSLMGIFEISMPLVYGEGDNAFNRLQEEIRKSVKLDRLLSKLPTNPQAAFNSLENQYRQSCLPNTRVELLQDIMEWADGVDKRCIFWLNGIAGTGKSTIARTIARKYHDRGNLGASFFFSRGGRDTSLADTFFTTLAWQLATKIPPIKRYINKAILENPDIALHSLRDQWDQLILNPLSKLDGIFSPSTIVLVIDALDECDSERDIRILLRLLGTTSSISNIRLRIFITSRPEIPVRIGFSQMPDAERQVFVLHDILPIIVNRDLRLFFEHNFELMRDERGFAVDWPGAQITKRLVESSCGLFIWASAACRFIREGRRHVMGRISILINDYPSGVGPAKELDEIYTTVLKDSIRYGYNEEEEKELYHSLSEILGSIIMLFSPLSADSLAQLLHLPPSHISENLADLHAIFHVPSQMNRPIRPHHPTLRDFLLDKGRCRDIGFCIDEKQANKALGDKCIQLMSTMLKKNICGPQSSDTLVKDVDPNLIEECIPPELQYACLYWAQHYQQSGTRLYDGDQAQRFFQQHFLHWLEAVNLMGKGSQADAIIEMYQSLLVSADNESYYGNNCIRCPWYNCPYFSTGFSSANNLDLHISRNHYNQTGSDGASDITSEAESVFSVALSTASSRTSTTTEVDRLAADNFASLLLEDEFLKPLYTAAIQSDKIGPEKFERNFRRLLKQFSLNLGKEAENNDHRAAVSLVGSQSRYIASAIRRNFEASENIPDYEKLKGSFDEKLDRLEAVERYLVESDTRVEDPNLEVHDSTPIEPSNMFTNHTSQIEGGLSGFESEDSRSDDEDTGSQSLEKLPRLSKVKEFMVSSVAFFEFREIFRQFVNQEARSQIRRLVGYLSKPENKELLAGTSISQLKRFIGEVDYSSAGKVHLSAKDDLSISNWMKGIVEDSTGETWNWWPFKPRRRALSRGQVTLEWQCTCGETRYEVVPSSFGTEFVSILKHNPPLSMVQNGHNTSPSANTTPQSHNSGEGISAGQNPQPVTQNTQPLQNPARHANIPTANPNGTALGLGASSHDTTYVLLGINAGDNIRLAQIRIHGHRDVDFFWQLRIQYYNLRGLFRRWLSIWSYSHCDFVKFEKIGDNDIVPRGPGIPSPDDVNYKYRPKPVEHEPPITSHEFHRRFHACYNRCFASRNNILRMFHRCRRPCTFSHEALDRIPKKIWKIEESGSTRDIFWGIFAVERISFVMVLIYHGLILTPPFVFWFLWLFIWGHSGDLQNASVPFLSALGLLSLFWFPLISR